MNLFKNYPYDIQTLLIQKMTQNVELSSTNIFNILCCLSHISTTDNLYIMLNSILNIHKKIAIYDKLLSYIVCTKSCRYIAVYKDILFSTSMFINDYTSAINNNDIYPDYLSVIINCSSVGDSLILSPFNNKLKLYINIVHDDTNHKHSEYKINIFQSNLTKLKLITNCNYANLYMHKCCIDHVELHDKIRFHLGISNNINTLCFYKHSIYGNYPVAQDDDEHLLKLNKIVFNYCNVIYTLNYNIKSDHVKYCDLVDADLYNLFQAMCCVNNNGVIDIYVKNIYESIDFYSMLDNLTKYDKKTCIHSNIVKILERVINVNIHLSRNIQVCSDKVIKYSAKYFNVKFIKYSSI